MAKRRQYGTGTLNEHPRQGLPSTWSLTLRDNGKRVKSPRFEDKKDAENWGREYVLTHGANAANGTFEQAAAKWLASRAAAPPKMQQYKRIIENHLLPVFEGKRLREISTDDINAYISDKEAGKLPVRGNSPQKVGKTSIANHVSMIRSIWEYAADQGMVSGRNPAARNRSSKLKQLKPPQKKPQALGDVEFAKLWEAADPSEQAHLALLGMLGLRSQETAALQWGDWNHSKLTVARARKAGSREIGETKSAYSQRTLKCSPQIDTALRRHFKLQKDAGVDVSSDALMFPDQEGGVLDASNFRRTLRRLSKEAGIRTVLPHELRHTFAKNQINAGVNIAHIARMLGHRDAVITLREYISFMNDDLPIPAVVETSVAKARSKAKRKDQQSR